jgi:quercetin dioxygenase-like cupin family protein
MTIWFVQPDNLPAGEHARELVGDDYGGTEASVILVDAAPGQGPSLHKHAYAELFFVIDGEATFTRRLGRTRCARRRDRDRLA